MLADVSAADNNFYLKQTLRSGLRSQDRLRITRIGTEFKKDFMEKKIRFEPFWENYWGYSAYSSSRGVGTEFMEKITRQEMGIEAGLDIFKWFYLGESFQYARQRPGPDGAELETRLVFKHDIMRVNPNPTVYFFEEYYYNIAKCEAVDNETGVGILIPIDRHALNINWRHVDPIHLLDDDTIEVSITIGF